MHRVVFLYFCKVWSEWVLLMAIMANSRWSASSHSENGVDVVSAQLPCLIAGVVLGKKIWRACPPPKFSLPSPFPYPFTFPPPLPPKLSLPSLSPLPLHFLPLSPSLPPLSFFLIPSFPSLSPFPSLPLEVGPLIQLEGLGSAVSSLSGVWGAEIEFDAF